jgi:hypothetical protein
MPTVCTLTGKFVDGTGLARTGRVTFVPTVRGVSSADDLILSLGTVVRVLDASGSFSVDLYRTDDASWAPSGWVWTVLEDMVGATGVTYAIELESETANLADLSPVVVPDPYVSYVLQTTYDARTPAEIGAATDADLTTEETARIAADDLRTLGVTDVVRTNTKLDGHSSNSIDANATQSIILGGGSDGYPNLISAAAALQTIVGGYNNDLRGALAGSILGSQHAIMDAGSTHGCIAGGSFLSLRSADYSLAMGGTQNIVGEPTIATDYSAAVGGEYNTIYGSHSAILAGKTNTVGSVAQPTYGQYSSLLGGLDNELGTTANSRFSGIVGGRENGVQAEYGGIVGSRGALVRYPGAVAQALGTFVSQGDAQTYTLVMRRSITGASLLQILIDDTYRLVLPDNASWMFEINVVGRRVDGGAAQSAAYRIVGAIKRGVGAGSTALMGTPTVTVIHEDNAAWNIDCLADATNGNLQIRASAAAGATVQYVAKVSIVETIEAV